jgi:hypothetical protein
VSIKEHISRVLWNSNIFNFCRFVAYCGTVAELKFRAIFQCHDINSKTTFTLITLFFTLVMFLSFGVQKLSFVA